MRKLNSILLIDDDPTTNFLNEELIYDLDVAQEVHVTLNGQEALDFIQKEGKYEGRNDLPRPELIFLDINMPLMDGFEFLQKYKEIDETLRADIVVMFLTTTNDFFDKNKAQAEEVTIDFIEKPLSKSVLLSLIEAHFHNDA